MPRFPKLLILHPMYIVMKEALRRTWTMEWHGSKGPIAGRFWFNKRKLIPRHDLKDVFENTPHISPNFRGLLALDPEKCISCSRCARACPNKCIEMEVTDPQPPDWSKPKPQTFPSYFSGRCMYCGNCVETCPKDALYHTQFFDGAEPELEALHYPYKRLIELHKQHQECIAEGIECIPPEDTQAIPDKVEATTSDG
jgi:formate hydrogenlyase subunit 6/NADH:ubiquinone oxidoreductase subunit I